MSASSGSTLSFQRPLGRLRGGLRDALVLALVGSFTTWVALLSWKGFATDVGQLHGAARRDRDRGGAQRRPAALAAGARPPGGARPARRGRRRGLALHLRLARADRRGLAADGARLPGRLGDRTAVRRPRAARRTPDRPAAHRRRRRVHAARRHHGRHVAAGPPGRAAAADDLQHPGQPARWRSLVDRLHLHHHRLPADALPAGEPADRPVGPAPRPGGRRRPERLRGQQRRAALVGRRDRRGGHGAGDRRTHLHPDLRHPAVRQRVRPGWRRPDQDREPDRRPQARPASGVRTST